MSSSSRRPMQSASVGTGYDVIAYPARGQTPDQQSRDRYECHGWAVSQVVSTRPTRPRPHRPLSRTPIDERWEPA
jgi:hypothetical protein